MRRKYLLISISVLLAIAIGVITVSAGDPDNPPGLPEATLSYTLKDIYNRLDTGVTGTQTTFTEPTAGPSTGTMQTLNGIMSIAPSVDDTDGAVAAEILSGKTVWGLTSGAWGAMTGTMADNGAAVLVPSTSNGAIAQGYHNGSGYVEGDANLAAGNIRAGTTIFGVAGDTNVVDTSSGNAGANEIVSGQVAWVDGSEVTGTMADNGAAVLVPSTSNVTIAAGYHDGSGYVEGDADLVVGNIRAGTNIFGIDGHIDVVDTSSGNAGAGEIVSGQVAWVDGSEVTGTMTDNGAAVLIPSTSNVTIAAGYHDGSGYVEGDADLVAGNIRCGVSIFGVAGSVLPECVAQTGVTECWDVGGSSIPCSGTGQDGEYQAGCLPIIPPPPGTTSSFGNYTRRTFSCLAGFTDNGDGTVTDNLTGLIWLKNASCFQRNWTNALAEANGLADGSCGLTDSSSAGDWRLPNINELRSLFDELLPNPYLPSGHPFTGVANSYYWSSNSREASLGALALRLSGDPYIGNTIKTYSNAYVWPVRGGE